MERIRCAQSEYDLEILSAVMNAPKEEFLLCDLLRNDVLAHCDVDMTNRMKDKLNIPQEKKAILYMPSPR